MSASRERFVVSPVTYESIGHAKVRVEVTGDGVVVIANEDGLQSLIAVLTQLRDARGDEGGHIHLTPGMQLEEGSAALVLAHMA